MARPRIFISSTFYDLRQIREDIDRSLVDLGYEPIRHETGVIAYGKDERPEAGAYREVDLCDVLVAIIGGRYGAESRVNPGSSITQSEVRRALANGVQVFIFIEKNVLGEYLTYEMNKDVAGLRYRHVDNIKVFEFIDHLLSLPQNNAYAPFETAVDISRYLKEQFAGLFQRFLQTKRRETEVDSIENLKSISSTLKEVVTFLTDERQKSRDEAIHSILHVNNPVFSALATATNTPYRIYFSDRKEFETWIHARGWKDSDPDQYDQDSALEFSHEGIPGYLKITENVFDESGKLKNYSPQDWKSEWIRRVVGSPPSTATDDDIPF